MNNKILRTVDKELRPVIKELNARGLITTHSCVGAQGASDIEGDVPYCPARHSAISYINFAKPLPTAAQKRAKRLGLEVAASGASLQSKSIQLPLPQGWVSPFDHRLTKAESELYNNFSRACCYFQTFENRKFTRLVCKLFSIC